MPPRPTSFATQVHDDPSIVRSIIIASRFGIHQTSIRPRKILRSADISAELNKGNTLLPRFPTSRQKRHERNASPFRTDTVAPSDRLYVHE